MGKRKFERILTNHWDGFVITQGATRIHDLRLWVFEQARNAVKPIRAILVIGKIFVLSV